MDDGDWIVLAPAHRHGVHEDDMLHALAHSVRTFDVGEQMTMVIGPSRTGHLLEVGVIQWHGVMAIAHADSARRKFL